MKQKGLVTATPVVHVMFVHWCTLETSMHVCLFVTLSPLIHFVSSHRRFCFVVIAAIIAFSVTAYTRPRRCTGGNNVCMLNISCRITLIIFFNAHCLKVNENEKKSNTKIRKSFSKPYNTLFWHLVDKRNGSSLYMWELTSNFYLKNLLTFPCHFLFS